MELSGTFWRGAAELKSHELPVGCEGDLVGGTTSPDKEQSSEGSPGELRSGKHSFSSSPSRQGHCLDRPRTSCSHPCPRVTPAESSRDTRATHNRELQPCPGVVAHYALRASCCGSGSPTGLQSWWGAAEVTMRVRSSWLLACAPASMAQVRKPRSRRENGYLLT